MGYKSNMIRNAVICGAFAISLSACETIQTGEGIGTIAGGALGGLAGNQLAKENKGLWTLAGAAAGAFIGNQIGKYVDERDQPKVAEATVNAAESGTEQDWKSEETGASGTAKVVAVDEVANCKEIEQTVSLADGTTASETVKACKDPDGVWTTAPV